MVSLVSLVCVSLLLLGAQGQDFGASMWRGNDQSGRCQYTFTVASPSEVSCPSQAGGPEMEALKSRLSLLEAMVTRLASGETAGPVSTPGPSVEHLRLQDAYRRATREKAQLQSEKNSLDRQVQDIQRRLEEAQQETERLRSRPCIQTPPVRASQQDSVPRPAGGEYQSPPWSRYG